MKSIADKEATVLGGREKRQRLQETIRKHEENHPGQVEKLMELKEQLAELERTNEPAEVNASNFQRIATREAMYLLLNGMHEFASKMDIIASFGKYIVDELDVTPVQPGEERPPYQGKQHSWDRRRVYTNESYCIGTEQTTRIVKDAKRSITNWRPDGTKLRRTLTSHHGQNPLVADRSVKEKQLPELPPKKKDDDGDDQVEEEKPNVPDEVEQPVMVQQPHDTPTTPYPDHSFKPDEPINNNSITPTSSAPSSPPGSNRNSGAFSVFGPPSIGVGGFSPLLFDQQPHNMYQFYQHYTPPRPYEEMARQHHPPPTHLSPHGSPFLGPGGFVMPNANPNFIHPQPSVSTSTIGSLPSASAPPQPHSTMPNDDNDDDNNDDHGSPKSSSSPTTAEPKTEIE